MFKENQKGLIMLKTLAAIGLVIALPTSASAFGTTLPAGVTEDVVSRELCVDVVEKLFQNKTPEITAFGRNWRQNSRGEMLSFQCVVFLKDYGIIYRTTRAVIEAEIKRVSDADKEEKIRRQRQLNDSGYL